MLSIRAETTVQQSWTTRISARYESNQPQDGDGVMSDSDDNENAAPPIPLPDASPDIADTPSRGVMAFIRRHLSPERSGHGV